MGHIHCPAGRLARRPRIHRKRETWAVTLTYRHNSTCWSSYDTWPAALIAALDYVQASEEISAAWPNR